MSFDAHADALRMELDCPEKMVLAILCHYASDDNQACWASLETLAFTVGVSKQTVRNKLKSLQERGYISRVIERQGATTVYVLDFAKIAQDARPRGVNVVEGSTSLRGQRGGGGGSTSLRGGVNLLDPINNNKQIKEEIGEIDDNPPTRFKRPTLEDVRKHSREKGFGESVADDFWHYWEAKDWMMGRNRMQKWKMAFVTWTKKLKPVENEKGYKVVG